MNDIELTLSLIPYYNKLGVSYVIKSFSRNKTVTSKNRNRSLNIFWYRLRVFCYCKAVSFPVGLPSFDDRSHLAGSNPRYWFSGVSMAQSPLGRIVDENSRVRVQRSPIFFECLSFWRETPTMVLRPVKIIIQKNYEEAMRSQDEIMSIPSIATATQRLSLWMMKSHRVESAHK